MSDKHIFCRDVSLASCEALPGTVGSKQLWLLLQDHSAWAPKAFPAMELPQVVRDHLAHFFIQEQAGILLIRNSDQKQPDCRKAFVVISEDQRAVIYAFDWHKAEDLLNLPYAAIIDGTYEGPQCDPVYLVCTHGKHDKCCAKYGLPVYRHLRSRFGERVWAASHLGGHRFAANLVCLPQGLYYGRVDPEQAEQLVLDCERGDLDPDAMRGRSCYSKVVQAADIFVRRHWGIARIGQLTLHSHRKMEETTHRVAFLNQMDQNLLAVDLVVGLSDDANAMSCGDAQVERVPVYRPQHFHTHRSSEADVLST